MHPYVYRHVVTLDETNAVGNVYFAHFLHWQGHCREHFLAEKAPGVLAAMRGGGLAMVTVSCSMDYYAECFAFNDIEVAMTLRTSAGNRIVMDFEFHRGTQLTARGTQTVACMRRADTGTVPTEIPGELAKAMRGFGQADRERSGP
jgi:enediyne biosynthesis thioesterase